MIDSNKIKSINYKLAELLELRVQNKELGKLVWELAEQCRDLRIGRIEDSLTIFALTNTNATCNIDNIDLKEKNKELEIENKSIDKKLTAEKSKRKTLRNILIAENVVIAAVTVTIIVIKSILK